MFEKILKLAEVGPNFCIKCGNKIKNGIICEECLDDPCAKKFADLLSILSSEEQEFIKRAEIPPTWTKETADKFWKSVGSRFTGCVEHMRGRVNNPEGFCSKMHKFVEGKYPREK